MLIQFIRNIKIIIVNDGSNDKITLKILRKLKKNKRIVLIILVIAFIELSGYGILASLSRLLNAL